MKKTHKFDSPQLYTTRAKDVWKVTFIFRTFTLDSSTPLSRGRKPIDTFRAVPKREVELIK